MFINMLIRGRKILPMPLGLKQNMQHGLQKYMLFEKLNTVFPFVPIIPFPSFVFQHDLLHVWFYSLSVLILTCRHTSLVCPFSVGDWPTVIFLRYLSLVSITLFQVTVEGSMSRREKRRISSSVRSSGFLVYGSPFRCITALNQKEIQLTFY